MFQAGPDMPGPVNFRGVRIGIPICEDIWGPEPTECIAETGGEISHSCCMMMNLIRRCAWGRHAALAGI